MADNFLLLYFTPDHLPPEEQALRINAALWWGGMTYAHIRVPRASAEEVEGIIRGVDPRFYPRLVLHDYFSLAVKYGLGGVQLNSRNPFPPQGWKGRVSRSCHTLAEAEKAVKDCAYVTLSPIFPSISKPGYKADFENVEITFPGVVALGGVTPERLSKVWQTGFSGAAILGWLDVDSDTFMKRLRRLMMIARGNFALQYITNGSTPDEVEQEVRDVLKGGCRWVQIRMKDSPDAVVEEVARRVAPLCSEAGAVCLLDDRVHLAARLPVRGVHLGKNDMSPMQAREILGEGKIIGSTANTLTDIENILALGASDYIGLGPFRFTTTKQRLAPVLGIEGYREIFSHPPARQLPVVAIGGIEPADVEGIMAAGASGVAVSGTIYRADDRPGAVKQFLNYLEK